MTKMPIDLGIGILCAGLCLSITGCALSQKSELSLRLVTSSNTFTQGLNSVAFDLQNHGRKPVHITHWYVDNLPSNIGVCLGDGPDQYAVVANDYLYNGNLSAKTIQPGETIRLTADFVFSLPPGRYWFFGFVDRQEAVRTEGKYIELLPGKVSKGAL